MDTGFCLLSQFVNVSIPLWAATFFFYFHATWTDSFHWGLTRSFLLFLDWLRFLCLCFAGWLTLHLITMIWRISRTVRQSVNLRSCTRNVRIRGRMAGTGNEIKKWAPSLIWSFNVIRIVKCSVFPYFYLFISLFQQLVRVVYTLHYSVNWLLGNGILIYKSGPVRLVICWALSIHGLKMSWFRKRVFRTRQQHGSFHSGW